LLIGWQLCGYPLFGILDSDEVHVIDKFPPKVPAQTPLVSRREIAGIKGSAGVDGGGSIKFSLVGFVMVFILIFLASAP